MLSPIFDSISKSNYTSAFDMEVLKQSFCPRYHRQESNGIRRNHDGKHGSGKGFRIRGVVVLGDLWNRFNIHSTLDYKELINHFRKLRKAAD